MRASTCSSSSRATASSTSTSGLIGKFDVHPVPGAGRRSGRSGCGWSPDTTGTAYADLRGATTCDAGHRGPARRDRRPLGPDPLRAGRRPGRAPGRGSAAAAAPIGDLLMDQAVLAGVGNVYRAEVLFRHRIHPLRPGSTLRVGQFRRMWDDLVELMAEGVRTGRIDTVRPEHTPEAMGRPPRVDDHGGEVYVYRRTGQPCHVCGARGPHRGAAGRNLFWCPRCQPRFRSRAVQ